MSGFLRDDPWLVTQTEQGWKFSVLVGVEPLEGLLDVHVESPDGVRFVGTLGTLDAVQQILDSWKASGECLGGSYFWNTGLVLLDEVSEEAIFNVLVDLCDSGTIETAFERVAEDD